jgi:hypothetical protein
MFKNLMKTPGGRRKLAAVLGPSLSRRLMFRTVAEQAFAAEQGDADLEFLSAPSIPYKVIKDRRFDLVARSLNLAMAEIRVAVDRMFLSTLRWDRTLEEALQPPFPKAVVLAPKDVPRRHPDFRRETHRKHLKAGIEGYMGGTIVLRSREVKQGVFSVRGADGLVHTPLRVECVEFPGERRLEFQMRMKAGVHGKA